MQLETILALKAFVEAVDGGQHEPVVRDLVKELDHEANLIEQRERERLRKIFRQGAVTEVEVVAAP